MKRNLLLTKLNLFKNNSTKFLFPATKCLTDKTKKVVGLLVVLVLGISISFGQTPLATNNFNSGLGTGWTIATTGGTAIANAKPYSQCSAYPNVNNCEIFDSYWNASGKTSTLTTPAFSLVGYSSATLSIDLINKGTNNGFVIQGSIDGGSTWQGVNIATNPTTSGNDFVPKTYSLGVPYLGASNVKIRFVLTSNYGSDKCQNDVFLDNVGVTGISCTPSTAPTSITSSAGTTLCTGGTPTTLTSTGGTNGSNVAHVWSVGSCPSVAYTNRWDAAPTSYSNTTVNSVTDGILNVTSTTGDPMINMYTLGSFSPTTYKYINVRYRVVSGSPGQIEIFFTNGRRSSANADQRVGSNSLVADGTWHNMSIDMSPHTYWTNSNVTGWRFDWSTGNNVRMEFDFIELASAPALDTDGSASITVSPAVATTYFTRKIDNCGTSTGCASQTISIGTPPVITGPSEVCIGSTIDLDTPGEWASLPTGGTITTVGNDKVHTFSSSSSFNSPININASVLVVAGGGGGGSGACNAGANSAGGAGGLLYQPSMSITSGAKAVAVGSGGATNNNGSNSAFNGLTAIGGGRGGFADNGCNGSANANGATGGSGGSGMNYFDYATLGGNGTSGQGNAGAAGLNYGYYTAYVTGGGGGAGGAGGAATGATSPGNGGIGLAYSISGTSTYYAGGGGGHYMNGASGAPGAGTIGQGGTAGGAGKTGTVIVRYAYPHYTSSNLSVATVNEITGVVTGVSAGTTTITYVNINGCTATKTITIPPFSTAPTTATSNASTYCSGEDITLTQSGGTDGTNAIKVWYMAAGEASANLSSCDDNPIELFNSFIYEKQDPSDCEYVNTSATNQTTSSGITHLEVMGADPFIWMYPLPGNQTIDASTYKYVNFRYKINEYHAVNGYTGEARANVLFTHRPIPCATSGGYSTDYPFTNFTPGDAGRVNLINDGQWHIASFKMSAHANWNGNITGLRIDYFDPYDDVGDGHDGNIGSKMDIDFITVSKHPMVGEGNTLVLDANFTIANNQNQYGKFYPPTGKTTFYAKKIDNCGSTSCASVTIDMKPTFIPGTINTDQTICSGTAPAAFTQVAPTGGGGTYTYQWQKATDLTGPWTNISGATAATYTSTALTADTYFRRKVTDNVCGEAYATTPITPVGNLKLHYKFDKQVTAGTVLDYSGNGKNGKIESATAPTWVADGNNGVNGGSYQFNGANPNNKITSVDLRNVVTNNMTFSAWVYRESSVNSYNMFAGQHLPYFAFNASGKFQFSASIGGQKNVYSTNTYADNQWYHYTATFDGANMKLYINGELQGTTAASGTQTIGNGNILLTIGDGRNTSTWYPFKGKVDEVRVYNTALSANQIKDLYENSAALHVTVQAPVVAGAIGTDQLICTGGDPAAFTSTTAGSGDTRGTVTYRWEKSDVSPYTTWTTIAGATSATYDAPSGLTVTTKYRRVTIVTLNGKACEEASSPVTVTVFTLQVARDSKPTGVCVGGTASFQAEGNSGTNDETYQWQIGNSASGPWSNLGATDNQYKNSSVNTTKNSTLDIVNASASLDGKYYRCTISYPGGCSVTSTPVKLSVGKAPTDVSVSPTSSTKCEGDDVTFTASVSTGMGFGTTPSYRVVFTSAYGGSWHGIQEIQGNDYNNAAVALTVANSSSATYSDNFAGTAAGSYGPANAFDGKYYPTPTGATSAIQWLSPENTTVNGLSGGQTLPVTNWQNSGTYDPFYNPEWIEFNCTSKLKEIKIKNGRYDTGASTTCFKDYYVIVSYDNGQTWSITGSGTLQNDQSIFQTVSLEPTYTWKKGGTSVGTGNTLNLTNLATTDAGTYDLELSYGCVSVIKQVTLTVNPLPVVNVGAALPAICQGSTSVAMGGSVSGGATGGTWSGGTGTWTSPTNASTAKYKAGASESGDIVLTLTSTGGSCGTATDTKTIHVDSKPDAANNTTATGAICTSSNKALTATPVGGSWSIVSGDGAINGSDYEPTGVTDNTSVKVRYTVAANGACPATTSDKTFTVNMKPVLPTLSIDHNDETDNCWGREVTLTITDGELYGTSTYKYGTTSGGAQVANTTTNTSATHIPTANTTNYYVGITANGACPAQNISTPVTYKLPAKTTSLASNNDTRTCYMSGSNPILFYTTAGKYLGSINPQGRTGNVTMSVTTGPAMTQPSCNDINNPSFFTAYMGRITHVDGSQLNGNGLVDVILAFSDAELTALQNKAIETDKNSHDNINMTNYTSTGVPLSITKVSGANNDFCDGINNTVEYIPATGLKMTSPNIANTGYVAFSVSSFSYINIAGANTESSPLPITLESFSGNCNNGVELTWVTGSENNVSHYEIYSSIDGSAWNKETEVTANGNSSTELTYTTNVRTVDAISYYRLRSVDNDGQFEDFSPISVACDKNENIWSLYPIPAIEQVTVTIQTDKSIKDQIILMDMNGRIVESHNINLEAGIHNINLNINELSKGTYTVKMAHQTDYKPLRVVKIQ